MQGLDRLIDTIRRDDRDPALRADIVACESLDPTERPREDGAIPIACGFFPRERHGRCAGNIAVQDRRLSVLLTRSLPWGIPEVP